MRQQKKTKKRGRVHWKERENGMKERQERNKGQRKLQIELKI
jgi:hypothetical protein